MIGIVALVVFAATISEGWWDTPAGEATGLILSIFVAIAAVAGGVKGILYLWGRLRSSGARITTWWDERQRVQHALDALTESEGWPNGASSLKQSHHDIYDRVANNTEVLAQIQIDLSELKRSIEDYIVGRSPGNG